MLQRFEELSSAISAIYHHIQKIERDEMEKYGLKGPYAHYLAAMTRFPQGITAAQLGQECGRDKAAVSRAISDMERQGLISRDRTNTSGYRAPLLLTPLGLEAAHYVAEKAKSAVELGGQGLTDEARTAFYQGLRQIAANLQSLSESGLPDQEKGEVSMSVKIIIDSTADLPHSVK